VFRQRLKVSLVGAERIARFIEFQMTGAAERKEREPKLVMDEGAGQRGEENGLLMITNV